MPETAAAALQEAGVRITPQRLAIAEALMNGRKQMSANELFDRVRRKHPYIGRATVFRSLDMLAEAGVAQRIERQGHVSAYVWCEPGHHHHLVCSRCGRVEELTEEMVEPLIANIAKRRRFQVNHATLDFYGVCRICAD
jgi:Fur family ferric uptake transcriptional regulator